MAPSSGWQMSAIPPLPGGKQTSGERAEIDARDPKLTPRPSLSFFMDETVRTCLTVVDCENSCAGATPSHFCRHRRQRQSSERHSRRHQLQVRRVLTSSLQVLPPFPEGRQYQ